MNKLLIIAFATGMMSSVSNAATLYSIAPDLSLDQLGSCVYNTACGPSLSGNTFAAQEFSLSSNATVKSIGFNAYVPGTPATAANYIVLQATSAGTPGNQIASGTSALSSTTGPTGQHFSTVEYSFDVSPLALSAGSYFIAFQAVTTSKDDYLMRGIGSSGAFQSNDGGATFLPDYGGAVTRPFDSVAVTVDGDPDLALVPLPASAPMFGAALAAVGLAGLGARGRRKTPSI